MASPNNLPQQLTSFVGREHEIAEVKRLLAGARLLTLTGTGGCGKTRLALRVASELLEGYRDGVWFVDLAPLSDPALVPQAVAFALGVSEKHARPLTNILSEYLAARNLLLVLDNCEQVLDACVALADSLLRACPGLHILATSRHVLGVAGETTWRVPPLSLPDGAHLPDVEGLLQYEAIQLFVERARLKRPGFEVTPQNATYIVQLCRRLDGIPLAIELAAARMSVLALEQVVARLDERFRLLTDGMGAALPRQQTLRAAIDWSYDLLNEPEQALLRRLSVFAGSFSLEAVEGVCEQDVDEYETISLLSRMVDKSLVTMEARDGEARYRVLETIRQYAWEKLHGLDEMAELRARHLQWYMKLAEQAMPELQGPNQKVWLDRLESDHGNMRAALGWGQVAEGGAEWALRLAIALWRFWVVRGYLSEGRRWLEASLALNPAAPPDKKSLLLYQIGTLAGEQGDYELAMDALSQSIALFRDLGDKPGVSRCLNYLGILVGNKGDYAHAMLLLEESLALQEELVSKSGIANCLSNMGYLSLVQGEYTHSRTLIERSLALIKELGDPARVAIALNNLGHIERIQGEYGAAYALYEESLAIKRDLDDRAGIASSLIGLGEVAWCHADYTLARSLFEGSLLICRELGNKEAIGKALNGLGDVERCDGNYDTALSLYKDAVAAYTEYGSKDHVAEVLHNMGKLALLQGDYEKAAALFVESLGTVQRPGTKGVIIEALAGMAAVFGVYGKPKRAAYLLAAVTTMLKVTGYTLHPLEQVAFERTLADVRSRLDKAVWASIMAAGRSLPLDEAITLALDGGKLSGSARDAKLETLPARDYPAGLTRRELEVLRLIAEGLTNEQVAGRLFVSPNTVRAHLHSIFGKLDVRTRAGAIRFAHEYKLV